MPDVEEAATLVVDPATSGAGEPVEMLSASGEGVIVPAASEAELTVERPGRPHSGKVSRGTGSRGLLHDVGHGLATLSYLSELLGADESMSELARDRLLLMRRELTRLLELTDRGMRPQPADRCDLRAVAEQLVALNALTSSTSVRLVPGPDAVVRSDPSSAHRMLENVLTNAVRAAGPHGTVEISIVRRTPSSTTVQICDDGPGFGRGPSGAAALGLDIVAGLARTCGANVHVGPAAPQGTRASLTFANAADDGPLT